MRARRAGTLIVVLGLVVFGCSEPVEVGFNDTAGASGASSGGASAGGQAGAPHTGGTPACQPVECRGKSYECGDCDDDDGDGLIDASDSDCLGPCDDSEASFARDRTGTDGGACRQDCYFDRNSGAGNDCLWSHACDPLSVAPDFPPSGAEACAYVADASVSGISCTGLGEAQSDECRESCLPLTPNGCDCFGCCELPAGSNSFVWVGSQADGVTTCDASKVSDEGACRPCTPVKSCMNECEACEICVGRSGVDSSCTSKIEAPCEGGFPPCGSAASCGTGAYCITGCCVPAPR